MIVDVSFFVELWRVASEATINFAGAKVAKVVVLTPTTTQTLPLVCCARLARDYDEDEDDEAEAEPSRRPSRTERRVKLQLEEVCLAARVAQN